MTTSYTEKVRRIRSTSLIAYWPLNENDGTVAWDWGLNAYNATSSGVVPADKVVYGKDGGPCYKFDGSASYVDIYAALAGAPDAKVRTAMLRSAIGELASRNGLTLKLRHPKKEAEL